MRLFKFILILLLASALTAFFWLIDQPFGIVVTWVLSIMLPICKWANTPTDKFTPEKYDREQDPCYKHLKENGGFF